jgi:hypothetical protein
MTSYNYFVVMGSAVLGKRPCHELCAAGHFVFSTDREPAVHAVDAFVGTDSPIGLMASMHRPCKGCRIQNTLSQSNILSRQCRAQRTKVAAVKALDDKPMPRMTRHEHEATAIELQHDGCLNGSTTYRGAPARRERRNA